MPQPRVPTSAIALLAAVLLGCGGAAGPPAAPAAPPAIGELDTAALTVVRVEFCDLVPRQAIRRALAGGAVSASAWKNGDRVPGTSAGDVGHEVGCAWKGAQGRTAKAWVFARPVSASFARSVVTSAAAQQGCTVTPGPEFGNPSMTQFCTVPHDGLPGGLARVRYAGLFADTWLTCEVTGSRTDRAGVKARAGSWCASIATTLGTQE